MQNKIACTNAHERSPSPPLRRFDPPSPPSGQISSFVIRNSINSENSTSAITNDASCMIERSLDLSGSYFNRYLR